MAVLIFGTVLLLAIAASHSAASEPDLTQLSLEELMNIEIISVSRKAEKRSEAAAAVHVIGRDDIRRGGVTTIPAALQMVPGLHAARIDARKWAIAARGFNNHFVDKLLVLIDGRSVYTTLFSGVFWESQDTLLEDVERIEVIRGPGATLWGANAVNDNQHPHPEMPATPRADWCKPASARRSAASAPCATAENWEARPITGYTRSTSCATVWSIPPEP